MLAVDAEEFTMATGRAGSEVSFESNGETIAGYLAVPPSGRGRGVLVIQEWWGLVPHIRDVCDRLARAGLTALAPDLYRGEVGGDPDAAGRLMMDLEIPRAARDLDAAVTELLNNDAVTGPKVGAVGFCMGGQLALLAATQNRRIGAVVDFYGIHPNVTLDLSSLEAPVLGIFAENDEFIPSEAVEKLRADLEAAGVRAKFRVEAGAAHAFMNDSRPDVHDAVAAAACWEVAVSFLSAELP
jgi:carboxymethylenebutenolidase